MGETAEVAMKIVVLLLSAGAVYGGIRADLRNAHRRAEEAMREANRANERIDNHIGRWHDG